MTNHLFQISMIQVPEATMPESGIHWQSADSTCHLELDRRNHFTIQIGCIVVIHSSSEEQWAMEEEVESGAVNANIIFFISREIEDWEEITTKIWDMQDTSEL